MAARHAAPSTGAPAAASVARRAVAGRAVARRAVAGALAGSAVAGAPRRRAVAGRASPAAPSPDAPSPTRRRPPRRARRGRRRRVRMFPDEAALLDAVAAAAVAALAPLLGEVRAATRFGLVPLWNAAGDAVRAHRRDGAALRRTGPAAGARPRPRWTRSSPTAPRSAAAARTNRCPADPKRVPVRAACCLAYRTDPPVARASDALCTTCPLLAAPERAGRYAAWLDSLPDQESGPVR